MVVKRLKNKNLPECEIRNIKITGITGSRMISSEIKNIRESLNNGDMNKAFWDLINMVSIGEHIHHYIEGISTTFDILYYKSMGILDFDYNPDALEVVVEKEKGYWVLAEANDVEDILKAIEEDFLVK